MFQIVRHSRLKNYDYIKFIQIMIRTDFISNKMNYINDLAIEYNYINPGRNSIKDIINNTIKEHIRKFL